MKSLLFSFLILGQVASAQAQPFPNKPIELVVPSSPGGGVDLLFRLIGDELSKTVKVQVTVVNQPAGAGAIAAEKVAR
jgi:tripartite-type tricarboxylate transporter receptor subunit TctC